MLVSYGSQYETSFSLVCWPRAAFTALALRLNCFALPAEYDATIILATAGSGLLDTHTFDFNGSIFHQAVTDLETVR